MGRKIDAIGCEKAKFYQNIEKNFKRGPFRKLPLANYLSHKDSRLMSIQEADEEPSIMPKHLSNDPYLLNCDPQHHDYESELKLNKSVQTLEMPPYVEYALLVENERMRHLEK